ncbi:MAG: metallophosphoesterase [Candidatus Aenigmatarchaeota archaeon]|nr:metallophosphoesterase [Candidatus Aenigmarchaeota archaeon]
MKLLVLSDNHNDVENMFTFIDILSGYDFDAIIYAGDFSDVNVPKGFKQEDVAKIIIEELRTFKKPIFAIPGNNDNKQVIELIEKENISIHGKGRIFNGIGFYGFGGAQTPFNTSYEPKEDEIKKGLERSFIDVMNASKKIQVTHSPPIDTKLDYINTGIHVGSRVIRNFIEKYSPLVAVSAHIHESRGIDFLNNTLLINPGRFAEGYVGFIDLEKEKPEAKIINLIE